MSAIEKALRKIDGREGGTNPFAIAADAQMSPLFSDPPATGPRWITLALAVAVAAGVAWYGATQWNIRTDPPPPLASSPTPSAPAPSVAANATPSSQTASGVVTVPSQWLNMGGQAWVSGMRIEANSLWMTGLRNLSPTTIALKIGQQQTLPQAQILYARWASQMPTVALREPGFEPSRWTVLALPAPAELDQAHAILKKAYGGVVQWGTVAHWMTGLNPERNGNPWPVATATPSAPTLPATQTATPAVPGNLPPANATPKVAGVTPVAPPAKEGPAAVPARNSGTAAGVPPSAPTEAPSAPELSQSSGGTADEVRGAPVAARAIEADFDLVEQQLARGEHENALDGVLRLERTIGSNWRTRYLAGVAYSNLGRWDEARTALSNAQVKNTGHSRIPLYLSVAQQERSDHAAALETLNKALEKHPSMPELWLNKGHSLQALGRTEEGAAAYSRFLELSAQRADLQAQRAWVNSRIPKSK